MASHSIKRPMMSLLVNNLKPTLKIGAEIYNYRGDWLVDYTIFIRTRPFSGYMILKKAFWKTRNALWCIIKEKECTLCVIKGFPATLKCPIWLMVSWKCSLYCLITKSVNDQLLSLHQCLQYLLTEYFTIQQERCQTLKRQMPATLPPDFF